MDLTRAQWSWMGAPRRNSASSSVGASTSWGQGLGTTIRLWHKARSTPINYSSFHFLFHYPNITPTLVNHPPDVGWGETPTCFSGRHRREAIQFATGLGWYRRGILGQALEYTADGDDGSIKFLSDDSFAPEGSGSRSGRIVKYAGSAIHTGCRVAKQLQLGQFARLR